MSENQIIMELVKLKKEIPRQTYRTIMGQLKAGDVNGAKVGIERLKRKLSKGA